MKVGELVGAPCRLQQLTLGAVAISMGKAGPASRGAGGAEAHLLPPPAAPASPASHAPRFTGQAVHAEQMPHLDCSPPLLCTSLVAASSPTPPGPTHHRACCSQPTSHPADIALFAAAPDLASLATELTQLDLTTFTDQGADFSAVRHLPPSLRRVLLNPSPDGAIPAPVCSLTALQYLDLACESSSAGLAWWRCCCRRCPSSIGFAFVFAFEIFAVAVLPGRGLGCAPPAWQACGSV